MTGYIAIVKFLTERSKQWHQIKLFYLIHQLKEILEVKKLKIYEVPHNMKSILLVYLKF